MIHLLLHGKQLGLELVAQGWQGLADVVGQLLVEGLLEMGGAHAISHVSEGKNEEL